MAEQDVQPYPPAYDNREGSGRYRRRGFDRLLDRLLGRGKRPKTPQSNWTEELMNRQKNPYLRRQMLEEVDETGQAE